jgi:hypothetical protein
MLRPQEQPVKPRRPAVDARTMSNPKTIAMVLAIGIGVAACGQSPTQPTARHATRSSRSCGTIVKDCGGYHGRFGREYATNKFLCEEPAATGESEEQAVRQQRHMFSLAPDVAEDGCRAAYNEDRAPSAGAAEADDLVATLAADDPGNIRSICRSVEKADAVGVTRPQLRRILIKVTTITTDRGHTTVTRRAVADATIRYCKRS